MEAISADKADRSRTVRVDGQQPGRHLHCLRRSVGPLGGIDFDDAEAFKRWYAKIPDALRCRLVVEKTPSGGYHVIYRCVSPVCGNIKLAQRKIDDKIITLIETRGEGGLFLRAPTAGYEIIEGDIGNLPTLTEGERETLLQAAWALREYEPTPVGGRCVSSHTAATQRPVSPPGGDPIHTRPGDDFNARGDLRAVLKRHGWALIQDGENQQWRRPGKDHGSCSATLKGGITVRDASDQTDAIHGRGSCGGESVSCGMFESRP